MMRSLFFTIAFLLGSLFADAQSTKTTETSSEIPRPKLVVGLMVDQMRWDYLYRYYARYKAGGIKRLLKTGFTCENATIPYAQTVTAAGHSSVYTGSVPAINGIMGNEWYDKSLGRLVYCVEDDSVTTIGGDPIAEPMSPKNLWTTTITDELRLATNFRSKVVGVAIKDRGSILPAGHSGDAYWYDSKSGNFVTSTWYKEKLPDWVATFNSRKITDSLYQNDWNTLYPINTYLQSDKDNVPYEGRSAGDSGPVFPHDLKSKIGKSYGAISGTPFGNNLTLEFAKSALLAEGLGKDAITDFLAVSLSSPDYVGHQYGPNSIETEDTYLRMDADFEAFFNFLDKEVGKGQWLLFLTADHGVAHVPGFLEKNKLPGATVGSAVNAINDIIQSEFKVKNAILSGANYHLYLNQEAIKGSKHGEKEISARIIEELLKEPSVYTAFKAKELEETNLPDLIKERFTNGMNPRLSGDIIVVLKSAFFNGGRTGTTHGSWYQYDAHIPMVFMGWGVKNGHTNRPTHMTDIAPTIAALLHVQMPSGCIGSPVVEITD